MTTEKEIVVMDELKTDMAKNFDEKFDFAVMSEAYVKNGYDEETVFAALYEYIEENGICEICGRKIPKEQILAYQEESGIEENPVCCYDCAEVDALEGRR